MHAYTDDLASQILVGDDLGEDDLALEGVTR